MNYLPMFFQIKNRPCLVIGGGSIAARKVALLRKANGDVTVVSPELCTELAELAKLGQIKHIAESYNAKHIDNCVLVIAATDHRDTNVQVSALVR